MRIGDTVNWAPRKGPTHGGRPIAGTVDAEGYVECESCGKDFFVWVKVHSDKILSIEHNPSKPGYIA